MPNFWPSKSKRIKSLELSYTYQVGAEAKLIHPWIQLISAFYLRSHFSRCFWRWMDIFSWTWLLSSLCYNNNNRRCVNCCLLFSKFWSFLQLVSLLEGNAQKLQMVYGPFTVISSHFLADCVNIFQKEVPTIILGAQQVLIQKTQIVLFPVYAIL